MLFNSLTFPLFFASVLLVHNLPIPWRWRKASLLLASYLFYAAWDPPFVALLWISTLVDWRAARGIAEATGLKSRRAWLLLSIVVNLGMLGYFKYGSFLAEAVLNLLGIVGIGYQVGPPSIILPIGISFYTFQTLSYTADVYRQKIGPWHSFIDYALYVSFFPQLVAGPIVRAGTFLPQLVEERRTQPKQLAWGLSLLVLGLFEKVVVADGWLAPAVEGVYDAGLIPTVGDAWVSTLAFAGQLFCDFAGYSTCAIGAAACLGFQLPRNFRFPFAAIGFSDFWARWHISLSSWLRDYVYIPLGGNRKGPKRTYVNALTAMLLGGLWHGAAWTFLAWGAVLGVLVALEHWLRRIFPFDESEQPAHVQFFLVAATFLALLPTFTLFRSPGFGRAWEMLRAMCGLSGVTGEPSLGAAQTQTVLVAMLAILGSHWVLRNTTLEEFVSRVPWWVRGAALAAMILAILLVPTENRAFVYFQF